MKLHELRSQNEDVLSVREPERDHHARDRPLSRGPLEEGRKSVLVLRQRHIVRKLGSGADVRVVAQLDLLESTLQSYQLRGERPPLLLENKRENREYLGAHQNVRVDVSVKVGLEHGSSSLEKTSDVGEFVGIRSKVRRSGDMQ